MVFSTTNLFKGIPCPEGERCVLTNCIFAHDLRPQSIQQPSSVPTVATTPASEDTEPPAKRRRVQYDKLEDKPPSKADLIRSQLASERSKPKAPAVPGNSSGAKPEASLSTLKRPVSPPAAKANGAARATSSANNNGARTSGSSAASQTPNGSHQVTLNPTLIPNDPAGHAKRTIFLRHIHAEMARLNQSLLERKDVQFKQSLILLEQELIGLAVDEEEAVAREKGSVYGNIIKNRIAAYRKMSTDDWISHLKTTTLFKAKQGPVTKHPGAAAGLGPEKTIDTGLTPSEEVAIARHLVIKDQKPLAQFGYIPEPPTAAQAAEAAAAVETSKNYEICDRCTVSFQVYPSRNEEGLLTSNGKCMHHPNRKVFPQKSKADTGHKEPYYPCCNEVLGSAGCTAGDHHVFKASSPARLAAVMPFITTPANANPKKDRKGRKVKAVAFDCEMGYTTLGLEMIRLTAVSWPEGEQLVDVLVRPLGIVLDLNSKFSGVWPEDMANAIAYSHRDSATPPPPPVAIPQLDGPARDFPPPPPPPMPIVGSPEAARNLLCSYLSPLTPLIGHAIDNDLNVVRLCHPTIIDTVITFAHPRGLPLRYGLKMLSSKHLSRSIQQNDAGRGHDSLEDARATGDLVRVKVGEKWKLLRASGWKFDDNGNLLPPSPLKDGESESDGALADKLADRAINGSGRGQKRRRSSGQELQGNGLRDYLERGKAEGDGSDQHKLSISYLEDGAKGGGSAG